MKKTFIYSALALFSLVFLSCKEEEDPLTTVAKFYSSTYDLAENSSAISIPFVLSNPWPTDLTFDVSVGGTAIEGTDYEVITPKSITVFKNELNGEIVIRPIDNNLFENSARTITLTVEDPGEAGVSLGSVTTVNINLLNNDGAGSVAVNFLTTEIQSNEYLQETVTVKIGVSTPAINAITMGLTVSGTAVEGENYDAIEVTELTIPAGQKEASFEVTIKDTKSFEQTSTIQFGLIPPVDNTAVGVGVNNRATVTIINPQAPIRSWAPDVAFPTLWYYHTYEDVPVPPTGRRNITDPTTTLFDFGNAFAWPSTNIDPQADPNSIGFWNTLWTEEDFTRSINAFNFHRIYGGTGAEGFVYDKDISAASAGVRLVEALRLSPTSLTGTTGVVTVIPQQVTVYEVDRTDDGIKNPVPFVIGIVSGQGTYDTVTGVMKVRIVFDETALGGSANTVRNYEFQLTQRPS